MDRLINEDLPLEKKKQEMQMFGIAVLSCHLFCQCTIVESQLNNDWNKVCVCVYLHTVVTHGAV